MSDSDRCRAEIAAREKALRSGDPVEMEGLLQGLQDWAAELREIDRMMRKPLCIDLFCGLGGWTEGFLAEGYRVVGFDIEIRPYPAQLVIQDVLTIHGSQFKGAAVIVASPPCQKYSYLAMPWSRSKSPHSQKAKALRREWETNGPDNRLFDACFRIQREACEARMKSCKFCCGPKRPTSSLALNTHGQTGMASNARAVEFDRQLAPGTAVPDTRRKPSEATANPCSACYIPLIIENVRGAIPWVGRSAWNYGSFHLWGDVPALMPINMKRGMKRNPDGTGHPPGSWFAIADSSQGDRRDGQKVPGFRFDGSGRSFQTASVESTGQKGYGGTWFGIQTTGERFDQRSVNPVSGRGDPRATPINQDGSRTLPNGTKIGGDWFSDPQSTCRKHGSRSNARKMASAQIAKIPLPLAQHIAQVYKPREATA